MAVEVPADQGFDKISDFACYPDLVDVVRSVQVRRVDGGPLTSDWEVFFRNGVLHWEETDEMNRDSLRIAFTQTDGDFDEFSGHWCITPQPDGCNVHFEADFDFGIPSLAGILDPIAERTFRETIFRIVVALFGGARLIESETP
jgi:ribosome-associated toxin RatA of RatAB toxin-antitoxin module